MTDYFADLERHLHRAARRRARRNAAAKPVAVFAVAAAAIALVTSVGLPGVESEREVAAPQPTPAPAGCGERPPKELTDRFGVFRRPADTAPAGLERVFDQELAGSGRPFELWEPRHVQGPMDVWLYPAQMGSSCLRPDPAVCAIVVDGGERIPSCHRPPASSTTAYELQGGGSKRAFLVEDGVEVELDGERGAVGDNITVFTGPGVQAAHPTIIGELLSNCGREVTLTRAAPDERITELLEVFRRPGQEVPDDVWTRALAAGPPLEGVHAAYGRRLLERPDFDLAVVPAVFCREQEPGVCLTVMPKFPTEFDSACANLAQVQAGEATMTFGRDDQRLFIAAIVPDGTRAAMLAGQPMTVDGNVAWIETEGPLRVPPRVAPAP